MSAEQASHAAWPAEFVPVSASASPAEAADQVAGNWQPLRQAWRGAAGPEPGFRPGRARVRWNSCALIYDVVLFGSGQRNTALRLNEMTWERGDVCEIFLHDAATNFYLELHVTPENQRLQLRFPLGAIDAVRRGEARLEDFMISDLGWAETVAECSSDSLKIRAVIPVGSFAHAAVIGPASQLCTAVCRYDYHRGPDAPLLSSTAAFHTPSFHSPAAWTPLVLERAR